MMVLKPICACQGEANDSPRMRIFAYILAAAPCDCQNLSQQQVQKRQTARSIMVDGRPCPSGEVAWHMSPSVRTAGRGGVGAGPGGEYDVVLPRGGAAVDVRAQAAARQHHIHRRVQPRLRLRHRTVINFGLRIDHD